MRKLWEKLTEELATLFGGTDRIGGVRVKLDGGEAVVLDRPERIPHANPVDRPFAGDHVVMLAVGDVLDVQVPDAPFEQADDFGDRFAEHFAVTDVEVGAEPL